MRQRKPRNSYLITRIEPAHKQRLERLAIEHKMSLSELFRRWIDEGEQRMYYVRDAQQAKREQAAPMN